MKSILESKRSKAILGIGLIAIGIGAISKKVISYPTGGCMKGTQEFQKKMTSLTEKTSFEYLRENTTHS